MFTDPDFPPSSASLGFSNGASVQWERLQNLKVEVKKGKNVVEVQCNVLFDNIEPSDAKQGNLGDCYLLASFAALSERPHLIQNIFVTRQFNSRGRYTLRLFDDKTKAFVNVTIDDYVPVRNGKPIFAQLHTNEMWPILLEKAYAKLKGKVTL
jgi:calpain-15